MLSVQATKALCGLCLLATVALIGGCADVEPGDVTATLEICGDQRDNDNDGLTDCDDDDCNEFVECDGGPDDEICDDQIDNDGDGDTDCDDADCEDEEACDTPPIVDEVCDDQIDNDDDGDTDCDDADCTDDPACEEPPDDEICDDQIDNDEDGDTDCDDDDCTDTPICQIPRCQAICSDVAACPELILACGADVAAQGGATCQTACAESPDALAQVLAVDGLPCETVVPIAIDAFELTDICVFEAEICDDQIDNDGDETTDCADDDCVGTDACIEICDDQIDNDLDDATDCDDPDCEQDALCIEVCDDDTDNDQDGDIDCADADCVGTDACIEVCDDGFDNDLDDATDCDDPDCAQDALCIEICDDGEDNDQDDAVDCDDPDCEQDALCIEICDDGEDNDQDGLADCDDPDCSDVRLCFVPDVAEGQIVIAELMYDPQDPLSENNAEWLELVNTTDADIDLTNCVLSDASDTSTTLFDLIVPARAAVLLAASDDPAQNGGLTVDGTFDFSLNNGGDTISLTCVETLVDTVTYDDGDAFPDAQQRSIALDADTLDATANDDGANWCLADTPYFDAGLETEHLGTPGVLNAPCPAPEDLCGDGFDNDFDQAIDCDDEDCAQDPLCLILDFEICDDGIDNDRNGDTDCDDPGCDEDINCFVPGICPEPAGIITEPGAFSGDTTEQQGQFNSLLCESGGGPEDIYQLIAPFDTTVCIDTLGSSFDTVLYVHDDPCGVDGSEFDCNDDFFDGDNDLLSQLELQVTEGQNVHIFVDGFDNAEQGAYTLNVDFAPCPVAEPEICDDQIDNDLDEAIDCDDPDCDQDINCFVPDVAVGEIIITEIMYDTQAPLAENNAEWIELFNTNEVDVNLTGCVLSDTSQTSTTLVDLTVPAGAFVLLARNDDPNLNGGLFVDGTFGFALNNGGDTISLTCAETLVDTVTYDDGGAFPDARQVSIQLNPVFFDSQSNDLGVNWCFPSEQSIYFDDDLGGQHTGTPGLPNDPCPAPPEICNDGFDNDFDQAIDCDDEDCADAPNCVDPGLCPEPLDIITAPGTFNGDTSQSPSEFASNFCESGLGREDIYQLVPPADLTVCIDTLDSTFDTVLYVHAVPCGESELDCSDDIFLPNETVLPTSQIEMQVAAGESLFIFVDGAGSEDAGLYTLNVGFGPCTRPGPEICNDGIDNDLDEAIDCDDPDCDQDINCFVPDNLFPGAVIITEIMYDTQNPLIEGNAEWIELININEEDMNLTGCVLSDAGQNSTVLDGVVVPVSGLALLARSDDPNLNGGLIVDGTFDFDLNNGGDTITLTCGDTIVDTVTYDDGPVFPNAQQASMQLPRAATDFELNDDGANWCLPPIGAIYFDNGPGTAHRGTPGELNPDCPEPVAFDAQQVQALLDRDCTGCHGVDFPNGGLTLVDFEPNTIFQTANTGITLILPGQPDNSYLLAKIKGTQSDLGGFGGRMPQGGPFWSPLEIAGLELYIRDLAPPP